MEDNQIKDQPKEKENKTVAVSYEHDHSKQHPLDIPDILGHVLKFISDQTDMKNCRLVNSTWNLEACKVLSKRLTVTFLDKHSISTYLAAFKPSETVHPHSSYQFYNTEFDPSNPPLNQFFIEFGGRVKTMKLQLQTISFDYLHTILRQSLPNLQTLYLRCLPQTVDQIEHQPGGSLRAFPNVQELIFGTRDFMAPGSIGSRQWNTKFCYPFEKLLNRFPNVMKISLSTLDGGLTQSICNNMVAVVSSLAPNRMRHLTSLELPIEADEKVLLELTALNCPYLNNLDLTFTSYLKPQTVVNFFNMIGPNLTNLSLSFPNSYGYNFQHGKLLGQALRNVKNMTLTRFKWKMGFLEYMVQLKKLVFKETDVGLIFPNNVCREINLDILRIENTLTAEDPPMPISVAVLEDIVTVFPRMKFLHIWGLTDECLRVVYFNLPCLTTFECIKGEFTDFGITGVSLDICRDLAETTTYLVVDSDKLRTNLFIGNLTNLKNLRLESEAIGDLAILFGVTKCKALRKLHLTSPSITDVAIEAITTHLGHEGFLESLNVLQCPEVSEAGRFYIRESIPNRKILVEVEPSVGNERTAELCSATRFHRYCDAYVRRKVCTGRTVHEFANQEVGHARLLNGPFRRSWLLNHHRMNVFREHQHEQHLRNPEVRLSIEQLLFGEAIPLAHLDAPDDEDEHEGEESEEEYFGPAGAVGGVGENIEQDHVHNDAVVAEADESDAGLEQILESFGNLACE